MHLTCTPPRLPCWPWHYSVGRPITPLWSYYASKRFLQYKEECPMLNVVFKPHRTHLKADTADVQKVFAMLQLIPKPEVAQARPPLALALVIDTSGSMQEYADEQRAQEEVHRKGCRGNSKPPVMEVITLLTCPSRP